MSVSYCVCTKGIEGYFADTAGKKEKIMTEDIRKHLQEDYISDQITIEESVDPFKGERKGK